MLKQYRYKKALKKRVKINASFQPFLHNMLIEEEIYIREKDNIPYPNFDEYSILEKVDLIDNGKIYGRNKKRRSLLCRS